MRGQHFDGIARLGAATSPLTQETTGPMAKAKKTNDTGANLGFEAKLWQAAVKLRNNMDAAEYKHVVLGLIFLKYISDAFDEHHQQLETGTADPHSEWYVKDAKQRYAVLEDRDEYLAANVFWVPKDARWTYLQGHAKQPTIGKLIDDAMVAIERDNPRLDAAKFVGELRHAC